VGGCAVRGSGDDARLDSADRAAPAIGRRVGEAFAVALGRSGERSGGFVASAEHQQGESGASGRVAEPRQLTLARVGVTGFGKAAFSVPVARLLTLEMRLPVRGLRARSLIRCIHPPPRGERIELGRARGSGVRAESVTVALA